MQTKTVVKRTVDGALTVLLLLLMAFQVTGDTLHEWLGIAMTVLLTVHHILNRKWYGALLKGRYSPYRTVLTAVNTLLLAAIAMTALSGMSMSGHAVPFLYGMIPVMTARKLHLAMSYWSFLLMGVHIGLHLNAMTARPGSKGRTVFAAILAGISGIGLRYILKNGIFRHLLFRTHFAFLDYDTAKWQILLQNLAMLLFFVLTGFALAGITQKSRAHHASAKALIPLCCAVLIGTALHLAGRENSSGTAPAHQPAQTAAQPAAAQTAQTAAQTTLPDRPADPSEVQDGFLLIGGGSFRMGSPDSENWRIEDEQLHTVRVSSFYIDPYEATQSDYEAMTGSNPGTFAGEGLPAENISWLDAVQYANAKSRAAGLTPAYTVSDGTVIWERSANGYRLPTEAEWEYACRAGTGTPFNTEHSLSAADANFYGHYPYEIEENYFNNSVLEARPGEYRQKTVQTGSFRPNAWGLYDCHGNVNEWCWDYYGTYDTAQTDDPTGAETGTRHVYRGGGWNDFAKNMRSAYRAAGQADLRSYNLGVRLVRNADGARSGTVTAKENIRAGETGKMLIAFFSWSGNTRGIAQEIQRRTGADIVELTPVDPYSSDYNTVLMQAQEDQHRQARPALNEQVGNMAEYDTVLLGYPNWWASIPMPIATFLESYDFSGKTIIPFCSHGGGRFGQSLTAIAKLAPDAVIGEGLSVHYSGGSTLQDDISEWLAKNGIAGK